jgi:aarF domain-containing kinase
MANGGLYIKLGQHVAMLDHMLPPAYVTTMRAHLLDRCPASAFADVARVLEEDLGAPLAELGFSAFDPAPVASASLAQVHAATDAATGRRLAVKVQHAGLRETAAADLAVIGAIVRAVRWAAPGVDLEWLVEEARENLPRELDFRLEAANGARCAAHLAARGSAVAGRVAVPAVDLGRTSPRVLTMEFVDGCRVDDAAGLAAAGAPPAAVAAVVARAFAEMIFRHGDVHADPHAANMLVRKNAAAPGGWQLVLLDHGLYRRLSDAFRLEYAALWRALLLADVPGIEASARAMGAGGAVPLFASMVTQRPWADVAAGRGGAQRLRHGRTDAERERIRAYVADAAGEISALLAKVPRELLLLLKTNDCLRALDAQLGAGPASLVATARESERALAAAGRARRFEAARLELTLLAARAAAALQGLRRRLCGGRGGAAPAPAVAPPVVEDAAALLR